MLAKNVDDTHSKTPMKTAISLFVIRYQFLVRGGTQCPLSRLSAGSSSGIEETHYGTWPDCDKANHLDKKLLLSGVFYSMLYKLDMQEPQKNDC